LDQGRRAAVKQQFSPLFRKKTRIPGGKRPLCNYRESSVTNVFEEWPYA
jgi:hypothetical protein